ncbi:MAG: hypothetical protein J7L98_00670 [Candidatus Verstraetearchaeota archaeon]|nr:hypothetical protein [Candidatus Verstraetearchaeota archaeon]
MPRRRIKGKKKRRGLMFFNASEITTNMGIREILSVVFTSAESYGEIARIILEFIRSKGTEEGRIPPWVSSTELSRFINRRLGKRRRSAAYKVINEYLIPLGLLEYREAEGKYFLSRNFSSALRRLSSSYTKWLSIYS